MNPDARPTALPNPRDPANLGSSNAEMAAERAVTDMTLAIGYEAADPALQAPFWDEAVRSAASTSGSLR